MPHLSLIDPDADAADAEMASVLTALAAHGLHLPADTNRDNLMERIRVAGHSKAQEMGQGGKKPKKRKHPGDAPTQDTVGVTRDASGKLVSWRE